MATTKSKVSFELDSLKYTSKGIQISKPAAEQVAQKLYEEVLEGTNSAVQVVEMIGFMNEVGTALKAKEDVNGKNKWQDLVRDEIVANSDDNKTMVSRYGTKFSLAETGTKYDYTVCNDPIWENLNKQAKAIDVQIKEREKFLKAIKDCVIMSFPDPTTGELLENVEILPPIKTSTSSYKTELLKG